ncbi:energy transducer TonB [Pseudomonas sp. BN102]|uniref:energy transducer TonB n=1 Tax=Pseudomonas sp. BN102 TaxID=2567886 RepID=UPI002453F5DE|nr:energy transducer TonB [Pseudomonas sp. BN102]MDH4607382.1 energy transducer TonB [Pseudomonas sp. BN102]
MPRFPLYFSFSLALHAGVGWFLYGLREDVGVEVEEASAVMVQLVSPEPKPTPARAVASQQPVQTQVRPAKPIRASRPTPVVASKPRLESPVAWAESAKPRPAEPAKLQSVVTPPSRGEARPVASTPQAPARPALTEVFSQEPAFLSPPKPPIYPAQARRRNLQGLVLVEVRLDEAGLLREIRLLRSSGVESLDRSALDAVSAWRFRPETLNGQPVPSRVRIPIEFALSASR